MKRLTGFVISTKMNKTIVVEVERLWTHPVYKKKIRRKKKYLVDDQIGVKEGDKVIIEECRPISRNKNFKVIEVVKKWFNLEQF